MDLKLEAVGGVCHVDALFVYFFWFGLASPSVPRCRKWKPTQPQHRMKSDKQSEIGDV
jgi:hypothetical protein